MKQRPPPFVSKFSKRSDTMSGHAPVWQSLTQQRQIDQETSRCALCAASCARLLDILVACAIHGSCPPAGRLQAVIRAGLQMAIGRGWRCKRLPVFLSGLGPGSCCLAHSSCPKLPFVQVGRRHAHRTTVRTLQKEPRNFAHLYHVRPIQLGDSLPGPAFNSR